MTAASYPQPNPHSQPPQMDKVKNVKKRKRTPKNHPFRFKKKPKPEFPAKALEGVGKALLEASRARATPPGSVRAVETMSVSDLNMSETLQNVIPFETAIQVLKEQMEATNSFYDLKARKLITMPAGRTQVKAVKLALEYMFGKPIDRKPIKNPNIDSLEDVKKKLAANPELLEQLKKMLAEAEARAAAQEKPDQPTAG